MNRIFVFGYGYVAQALTELLKAEGFDVIGTTRDVQKMRGLKELGIKATLFETNMPLGDPVMMLSGVSHILVCIPPDDEGCPVFNHHSDEILDLMPDLKWVGVLSSTAVYGDRDGGVVDEKSEVRPTNKRGSRRALAEAQWLARYSSDRLPVHVFRLAGIYGPGRSALDAVRAGNSRRIYKPGHAFSRIHVDDVAQILKASINAPSGGAVYNVADDAPSPSHELIKLSCELLGLEVPPLLMFDEVDMAPMARSFYLDNKRINNTKIKQQLGVALKYPSFEQGLPACLEVERAGKLPDKLFLGGLDAE